MHTPATKPVYQLSRAGLFLGMTVADESPLEPGVWHMPALTIATPPPADWPALVLQLFSDDQAQQLQAVEQLTDWPRWNGSAWELVTRPRPPEKAPEAELTPVERLAAFLQANPDVQALLP